MNRGDLMDAFGVSVNQASTDLNRYIRMAPDNMTYDKSARTYIRGSEFDSLFLKPDASRYLSQLRSVADGILNPSDAWIGLLPAYDAAPTPVRGVNAKTGEILYGDEIDNRYHCVCVEQTPDYAPILFEDVIRRIEAEGGTVGFRNGNGPVVN